MENAIEPRVHDAAEIQFRDEEAKSGKCSLCRHDTKMIPKYGGVCYRCWSDVEFYHYFDWRSGKPQWSKIV